MTVAINDEVERLSTESTLCTFCVAAGGLEEGLAVGFYWAVRATRECPVALCDAHRIRLSLYFDLAERLR